MTDQISPNNESKLEVVQNAEEIVARVDKDAFRAMFYLFAGKPDSKQRVYERKAILTPTDIFDLDERIQEKFKLHNIPQTITSASVSLEKNQTVQFGSWREFVSHNWKVSYPVKEVTLQWDFLIKLQSHAAPQRHTLTVKFSAGLSPGAFLQVVFSSDNGELNLSNIAKSCIARVDFISHALADELLSLVGEWHSALPTSTTENLLFSHLEDYDSWIASAIRYSIPIFSALALGATLWEITSDSKLDIPVTLGQIRMISLWILCSIVVLSATKQLGEALAKRAYRAVNMYGNYHPFKFTRGDDEIHTKIEKLNRNSVTEFWVSTGFALLLNIIAGILTWWFLPTS